MNVGARSVITRENYASKAALKRALAATPENVEFYSTELFTVNAAAEQRASELTVFSDTLYVVGPDPYTSRKWYAAVNVKEGRDGSPSLRIS